MDKQRILDQALKHFLTKNDNSLFASVLFVLDFKYTDDPHILTIATDYESILINEEWFISMPPETRISAIAHEMEHILRLHSVRKGPREAKIWNIACDYVINANLKKMRYTWENFDPLYLSNLDPNLSEEDLYDQLIKNAIEIPVNPMGQCCPNHEGTLDEVKAINTLNKIIQQNKAYGNMNSGEYQRILDKFIKPQIPWQNYLHRYLTKFNSPKTSWKHRNRRYKSAYIPKSKPYENRLIDLNYYVDVSGSITKKELQQVGSEIKNIKEIYNPETLNIIGFDTDITQEIVVKSSDSFNSLNLKGGGGTRLTSVYDHIVKHKPTVAIIFSDLCCEKIPEPKIDIIWIRLGNYGFIPKFGKLIQYD